MTDLTQPAVADQVDDILDQILVRAQPLGEMRPNLKMLIFSEPGGRKTSFVASAPKNFVIDSEDGFASIFDDAAAQHVKWNSVTAIPFKSFFQVEKILEGAANHAPQLEKYETFSIDTLSTMHKKGLAEVTEREWKNGYGVTKNGQARNRYVAETEDHTENNEHIRRIVDQLKDLDRNVIVTTHLRSLEQRDKSLKLFPDFSEKLANTINGMMDVVAYVQQTPDGVIWHTVSDGYIQCKNRIGLPPKIENPTWETIYGYFEQHLANAKKYGENYLNSNTDASTSEASI